MTRAQCGEKRDDWPVCPVCHAAGPHGTLFVGGHGDEHYFVAVSQQPVECISCGVVFVPKRTAEVEGDCNREKG